VQEAVRSADPKWQVRSRMPTWKRAQAHYKIICCAGQKSMDELRLTMRRIRDRPMLSITHERENTFTRGSGRVWFTGHAHLRCCHGRRI